MLSKLFCKTLGRALTKETILGKCHVPEGAVTYDFLAGTGKKGDFQSYIFKNAKGKIIERNTFYQTAQGQMQHQRVYAYTPTKNRAVVDVKIDSSGHIVEENVNSMSFYKTKSSNTPFVIQTKETSGIGDVFECNLLRKGKPKQGVKFETEWDGKAPKIEYININETFNAPNQEYLPLTISSLVSKTDKRISLIQNLQEAKYGMKGMCPPIIRVKPEVLGHGYHGDCAQDGTIRVADNLGGDYLLDIIGHEFKHASDWSQIYRVADKKPILPEKLEENFQLFKDAGKFNIRHFYEESLKKGIIPYSSDLGRYYRNVLGSFKRALTEKEYDHSIKGHDSYYVEKRANREGQRELDKLKELRKNLYNFVLNPNAKKI